MLHINLYRWAKYPGVISTSFIQGLITPPFLLQMLATRAQEAEEVGLLPFLSSIFFFFFAPPVGQVGDSNLAISTCYIYIFRKTWRDLGTTS